MIGQGVLRECLRDPDVAAVTVVGRSAAGASHPKLHAIVHRDMRSFAAIERELRGVNACFFCLGVTSAGLTESEYERVTYDIPVAAATVLARQNPAMTFILVSGAGADSSERGRVMWARVKGESENGGRAADARHQIAHRVVQHVLLAAAAGDACHSAGVSKLCADDGGDWTGDAPSRARGRAEACARKPRYQRAARISNGTAVVAVVRRSVILSKTSMSNGWPILFPARSSSDVSTTSR